MIFNHVFGPVIPDKDYLDYSNSQLRDSLNTIFLNNNNADPIRRQSIPGNEQRIAISQAGDTECVGAIGDNITRRIYYFIKNSNGNHGIYYYDYDNGTVNQVLVDPILNFDKFIDSIHIVDGKFIYWINNELPYMWNVLDAQPTTLTEQRIYAGKYDPVFPITKDINVFIEITNTENFDSRQYIYRYIYKDNQITAWSPYSAFYGALETLRIPLTVYDRYNLDAVEIASRDSETGQFRITDYIEDIPTSGNINLKSQNKILGSEIPIIEIINQYNAVPILTKTSEIVDNNIVYANNLIGRNQTKNIEGFFLPIINLKQGPEVIANQPIDFLIVRRIRNASFGNSQYLFYWNNQYDIKDYIGYQVQIILLNRGVGGQTSFTYTITQNTTINDVYDNFVNLMDRDGAINGSRVFRLTDTTNPGISGYPNISVPWPDLQNGFVLSHEILRQEIITTSIPSPTLLPGIGGLQFNTSFKLGIRFYDKEGRSGPTNPIKNIETRDYHSFPNYTEVIQTLRVAISKSYQAPVWAKSYALMVTKPLRNKVKLWATVTAVTGAGANDRKKVDLTWFFDYVNTLNVTTNKTNVLEYSWEKGDMVRVIRRAGFNQTDEPVRVLDYDAENLSLITDDQSFQEGDLILVYNTKGIGDENIYYEVGHGRIVNRVLQGEYPDEDNSTNYSNHYLENFHQIFFMQRQYQRSTIGDFDYFVCSNYDKFDFQDSNYLPYGRIGTYDPKARQARLTTQRAVSQSFIENTRINGLNTFYADSVNNLPIRLGSVNKELVITENENTGGVLLSVGDNGCISTYIGKIQQVGTDGTLDFIRVQQLLGSQRDLLGEYSCIHPTSLKSFRSRAYFFDYYSRDIARYSNNGIIGLGKVFGFKSVIENFCNGVKPEDITIRAEVHPEYQIYFCTLKKPGDTLTIGFGDREGRQTYMGRYSFVPECYASLENIIFTWNNAIGYEHLFNGRHGQFFGQQFETKVTFVTVSGQAAFDTIFTDSNVKVRMIAENNSGQKTSLNEAKFIEREGRFYAHILRDENTNPAKIGSGEIALLSGDVLVDDHLIVTLFQTGLVEFREAHIGTTQMPGHDIHQNIK